MENIKEQLEDMKANFKTALSEYTRASGYVEGTLDTVIGMSMDTSPEMTVVSDRLIKSFRDLERLCKQGLSSEFEKLLGIASSLFIENENLKQKIQQEKDLNNITELLASKASKAAKDLKKRNTED